MKIKLSVWDESLKFPELCCITGKADPTIEKRPIASMYFFLVATVQNVDYLPISREGWKKYRDSFTGIDRLNESANNICLSIPLIGGLFHFIYILYVFLPLAIPNMFIKRSRGKVKVSVKKEGTTLFLRGAILEIPSEEFGKQFIELNKEADATEV